MTLKFDARFLWKDRLITVVNDHIDFQYCILNAMKESIVIPHNNGISIKICDYSGVAFNSFLFEKLMSGVSPFYGRLIIFGSVHESNREIIFLLSVTKHILCYEKGNFFYLAPNFKEFWNVKFFFNEFSILHKDRNLEYFIKYFKTIRVLDVFQQSGIPKLYMYCNNVEELPSEIIYEDSETPPFDEKLVVNSVSKSEYFVKITRGQDSIKIITMVSRGTQCDERDTYHSLQCNGLLTIGAETLTYDELRNETMPWTTDVTKMW